MSETEFRELVERRGFHSFVLILNARPMHEDLAADLRLRMIVAIISLLGVAGLLVALTQWGRSTSLLLKLVQSQQQNENLRELNLAAAGLAHETRNPLNVVRGVAQMIDQDPASPPEIRTRVRQIMEEIDMVTFRLNEFIRYSRPPQPHLVAVNPTTVAENVRAALQSDIEGRDVEIHVEPGTARVEADEMLLRQLLFNLVINAVQAVRDPGRISVALVPGEDGTMALLVDDNGPGVADDLRQEIFRPYFTTSDRGSGLGLAVVRQICAAHGWTITCGPSPLGGARFTLAGLHPTTAGPTKS
jgi:signal transduction histidine kinase